MSVRVDHAAEGNGRGRTPSWSLACLGLLALAGCGEPDLDVSGGTGATEARELVLSRVPREGGGQGPFEPSAPEMRDAFAQFHAVAVTESAKGLFLQVGSMRGAWGRAADLAEALAEVREAGKPVHCHFAQADNTSYWFMTQACDRISMTPAGMLNLVGVAAQVFYARDLLASVGIEPQLLAMGRYKSAGDTFTETEMPESTREALGAVLDDYQSLLLAGVARRMNDDADRATAAIDVGPYAAERAQSAGLIDAVEFDDEARSRLRDAAAAPNVRRVEMGPRPETVGLLGLIRALSGKRESEPDVGPHVAMVVVDGPIVDADRQTPGRAASLPFVEHMRALAKDDDVRSVVLRINSPGGSALASDLMWHAVRRVAGRKPVIVSVGDVAASGGYYIAAGGTEIFAQDSSLVGSIGVIGGKVHFGNLAQRLGVNPVVLERGANSAWASPVRAFQDGEREVVHAMLSSTYRRFISRVSNSRGMEWDAVTEAAEGRVLSGRAGRELGLVDSRGGLFAALGRARALGELTPDAPVRVWPERGSMLETIASAIAGGSAREVAERVHGGPLPAPLDWAVTFAELLGDANSPVVALPYLLEVY